MRVAIIAEQNFNLIDGSTIWLLNACKLLDLQPDLVVTFILRTPLSYWVLANELPARIKVRDHRILKDHSLSEPDVLTAGRVPDTLIALQEAEGAFDRIFVRGADFAASLLSHSKLADKVTVYAPSVIPDITRPRPEWMQLACNVGAPIVVQSEVAKRVLESLQDIPADTIYVVPPVAFPLDEPSAPKDPKDQIVLCYSGKIDAQYGLNWLIDCIDQGVLDKCRTQLVLLAGKDTNKANNRAFFNRMDRLRSTSSKNELKGVSIFNELPHGQAKREMSKASFAYCLRDPYYDDIIEISTKMVEFSIFGVPLILNDTALNRSYFGDDYPYFVDTERDDVLEALARILKSFGTKEYDQAKAAIAAFTEDVAPLTVSDKLANAVRKQRHIFSLSNEKHRYIHIATHEPKFIRQFLNAVQTKKSVNILLERWPSTSAPPAQFGADKAVDTIFCEWCCENAVYYSNNKPSGVKLIIRLHRFEAFREFPKRVNWASVDALIVVSQYFRDLMISNFSVPEKIIHVAPQYIDWAEFQRPKLPQARYTVGLVGINPFEHKRMDRALDFIVALRKKDPRFSLAIRSVMPWNIEWVWKNLPEDRVNFIAQFERIYVDPMLKDAVRIDPAGVDMEEWYRGIGTIISSSSSEGCHTSIMEGMASGAMPVVYNWPGAQSIYSPYVFDPLDDAIDKVIAFSEIEDMQARSAQIRSAAKRHDINGFFELFFSL